MNIRELAGVEIDEYKLVSIIGQGGMSAVYRAYQEELDRDVAIKILAAELAQDPNYIKRFQAEAKMSAALEHSHIVPVYDYGVQDGLSFVVMRLLRSTLTDQMYAPQAMSMNDVLTMLEQVAKALDYAHSKGIVHRDVKPSNIMFDDTQTAYLVDFGIAKATQQTDTGLTVENVVLGTPSYMPPELWRGDTPLGASDQYALAIVTFQVLTGQLPYQSDSPSAVMYKHLNDTIPIASEINPNLPYSVAEVIQRGMHKDPYHRYSSVADFVNALSHAMTNPPSAVETQERQAVPDSQSYSVPFSSNEVNMQQTVPIQVVPRPPQLQYRSAVQPSRPMPRHRRPSRPRRYKKRNRKNTVMMQVMSGGIIGLAIIFILLIIALAIAIYFYAPYA